jgi:hypothetical protein
MMTIDPGEKPRTVCAQWEQRMKEHMADGTLPQCG